MAKIIFPRSWTGYVGPFEPKVVDALKAALPDNFVLIPNFGLKPKGRQSMEFDVVVLGPFGIWVVEAKEWYGRLSGDDQEWLLNRTPKKCGLWLLEQKAKELKSLLGGLGTGVYVTPLYVVPDALDLQLDGGWRGHVVTLARAAAAMQSTHLIPGKPGSITAMHDAIAHSLLGQGAARSSARTRLASYEIVETLSRDADSVEYLAKRALIEEPTRFRIRTWHFDGSGSADEVARRRAVIARPTEAVAKIGAHPNLLSISEFNVLADESLFYEVTEWSEFGTLYGVLTNSAHVPLTLRDRLEIAAGVLSALEAVHACGVVHRALGPKAVLLGRDRVARLTDFDRAFLDGRQSVFSETARRIEPAYLAPELEDISSYDFDVKTDMYSFGVLLYRLLTDKEPFASPAAAKAAGGIPSRPASATRPGLNPLLDELVLQCLHVDDFQARPSASEARGVLERVLGRSTATGPTPAATTITAPRPARFDPGSIVDETYRIDAYVGQGGFAKVYRVFHLEHQRTYAMKVMHGDASELEATLREWNEIVPKLPPHPTLARPYWMARLHPPDRTPYILYEYIDGETLQAYCDGRKRLTWSDTQRIGVALLDALGAMHATGILHRDIKPSNVMLALPGHEPKLIDFNVSSALGASGGRAGTPRYWAPDAGKGSWRSDMDLFSLGVVLFELATHTHPFRNSDPLNGPAMRLSDVLPTGDVAIAAAESFFLRALADRGADRFASAAEMRLALEDVVAITAPPPLPPPAVPTSDGPPPPNTNPWVAELLTLYSQARRSNVGTRGLDRVGEMTYVDTRLDTVLAPRIAAGKFRLVIVTGNAGDGKTAFLQRVEALFKSRLHAGFAVLASDNGARWTDGGLDFETNYDGSQDEGDTTSDDVLARFFQPFEGESIGGVAGNTVRLLAINEGRLLDFLEHGPAATRLIGLRRFVKSALGGTAPPGAVLLVNLNARDVTAAPFGKPEESLVIRQLDALLSPALWASCDVCALKTRCPIVFNVDSLRDPVSGVVAKQRLHSLFSVVHLRRRAHITMRDVRSALSWLLLRDQDCSDVAALLGRDGAGRALASLAYWNAFSESGSLAVDAQRGSDRTVDRLVSRLLEADVGRTTLPALDRMLDHAPLAAVPWTTFELRSPHLADVLLTEWRGAPRSGSSLPVEDVERVRREVLASLRRRAYFERRDDGHLDQLPYSTFPLLLEATGDGPNAPKAREDLLHDALLAISLADGARAKALLQRGLALATTRARSAKVRSFRVFPRDKFEVRVERMSGTLDVLELSAGAITIKHREGHARLVLTLDLLEMLDRVRAGHRPTPEDLQGAFVNLLIFRNELMAEPFLELFVTQDDVHFVRIEGDGRSGMIRLRASDATDLDERSVSVAQGVDR